VNSNVDSHLAAVKELYNIEKNGVVLNQFILTKLFNFMSSMCLLFKFIKLINSSFIKFRNTKENKCLQKVYIFKYISPL